MKFYYPRDKKGNRIGFKTAESQVFDKLGRSLTDKMVDVEETKATKEELNIQKARLDNFISKPVPSDSELVDIRVGADDETYESAGTAIREQMMKKVSFNKEFDILPLKTPAEEWINQIDVKGNEIMKFIEDTYALLQDEDGVTINNEFLSEEINSWLDENPETLTPNMENVQDNSISVQKLVLGTLGYVTPQMFGAVGDGVTDDLQAFKNMLQFESSFYIIPNGEYYLSNSITIDKSDVTIMMGSNAHIFTNTETDYGYTIGIGATNGSKVISNITIDGGIISNTTQGEVVNCIRVMYAKNVKIMNTRFTNATNNAIAVFNGVHDIIIRNIIIDKAYESGITVSYESSYVVIDNVTIKETTYDGIRISHNVSNVLINNVSINSDIIALSITDCNKVNVTNARLFNKASDNGCVYSRNSEFAITDSRIESMKHHGFQLFQTSAKISRCIISSKIYGVNYSLPEGDVSSGSVIIDNCNITGSGGVNVDRLFRLIVSNSMITVTGNVIRCYGMQNNIVVTNNMLEGSNIFDYSNTMREYSANNQISFTEKLYTGIRPSNMNDYVNGSVYIVEDSYMRLYSDSEPELTDRTTNKAYTDNDICYITDLCLEEYPDTDVYIGRVFYRGAWHNFGKIVK